MTSGKDYNVSYSKNKAVGTATITINRTGNHTGQKVISFEIKKTKNPVTLKISQKTYSLKKNLKKNQTFHIGTQKAQGSVTYSLSENAKNAKITVSTKGKVTIPEKCKKGIYTITVKAKGNQNYLSATKKVTIKVNN